ncbi:Urease accessory protein UreD [hydrothermal vent metagenome]|uniref:Urease accessory protein UreD n=1 Tax=hydrothermal vent metagenome TaxID=652676 RepID=A0A3B0TN79_9ZZZZ
MQADPLVDQAAASPVATTKPPPLERAAGRARIDFNLRQGVSVLGHLYQSGSAKLRLPRRHRGDILQAIVINTSGGLTDGDSFALEANWLPGTTAALASQAAERIYKSRGAEAHITTRLKVGDGATAFWLPQETIMFDGGRLRRLCRVELGAGVRFLAVESLVYGRTAMGETVARGAVRERFEIVAGGRLVWADAFAIEDGGGAIGAQLDRPAIAAGARATATVLALGPDPARLLAAARSQGEIADVHLAASCREDIVIARLLGPDGATLRCALTALLKALKTVLLDDRPEISDPSALPRVWAL